MFQETRQHVPHSVKPIQFHLPVTSQKYKTKVLFKQKISSQLVKLLFNSLYFLRLSCSTSSTFLVNYFWLLVVISFIAKGHFKPSYSSNQDKHHFVYSQNKPYSFITRSLHSNNIPTINSLQEHNEPRTSNNQLPATNTLHFRSNPPIFSSLPSNQVPIIIRHKGSCSIQNSQSACSFNFLCLLAGGYINEKCQGDVELTCCILSKSAKNKKFRFSTNTRQEFTFRIPNDLVIDSQPSDPFSSEKEEYEADHSLNHQSESLSQPSLFSYSVQSSFSPPSNSFVSPIIEVPLVSKETSTESSNDRNEINQTSSNNRTIDISDFVDEKLRKYIEDEGKYTFCQN